MVKNYLYVHVNCISSANCYYFSNVLFNKRVLISKLFSNNCVIVFKLIRTRAGQSLIGLRKSEVFSVLNRFTRYIDKKTFFPFFTLSNYLIVINFSHFKCEYSTAVSIIPSEEMRCFEPQYY